MNKDSLALDFKSANLYAVRVVLRDADLGNLNEALDKRMTEAGSFFENEPVIIDASQLAADATLDWAALVDTLRGYKLPVIGVVAEGKLAESAKQAGLTPVELSAPVPRATPAAQGNAADAPRPTQAENPSKTPAKNTSAQTTAADTDQPADSASQPTPPAGNVPAMVINRPLRSGQRVYARQADLVIIGMVSQGAEIIADGNIHVYGPLRGKAMAGARGDTSARIFSTQLDPELLAVAGIYRVVENKLDTAIHNRPAQVRLENETLHIEAL